VPVAKRILMFHFHTDISCSLRVCATLRYFDYFVVEKVERTIDKTTTIKTILVY